MEVRELIDEIDNLIKIEHNFSWESKESWGISEKSWQLLLNCGISPLSVFSHPRILQEQPKLSTYYRNLSVLPQKAVKKLAFSNIEAIELGKSKLSYDKALILCQLYNSHASLIIESADQYCREDITALIYASLGSSINGSWLNRIGEEAELLIKKFLIRPLLEQKMITSVIFKDGKSSQEVQNLMENLEQISGVRLTNQTSVLFSSEPDISLINRDGKVIAVMEIKGGKDSAGALERYGAAKKSFEEAKRINKEVITVFVASCITDEVNKRLLQDTLINHTYNLTHLVADEKVRLLFVTSILNLIGIKINASQL